MSISFADASIKPSQGFIEDLHIQIRNCLISINFEVVEMSNGSYIHVILGRPFLATAGALVDLPNTRITFSNIDKNIFYNAIPDNDDDDGGFCVPKNVVTKKMNVMPKAALCNKNEVNEVLDGHTHSYARERKKVNKRDKPKNESVMNGYHITLTPHRYVGDTIEFKLTCKGTSKAFL
ncbi:hypothetical protein V5N11_010330 [Cardamine amara subsp. amara]|uniref:Uncharacterized protein n=1 Tax=Cardamine amara subsp. amara TaxID=228776 RepID=A0ABD0ZIB2_CARAN